MESNSLQKPSQEAKQNDGEQTNLGYRIECLEGRVGLVLDQLGEIVRAENTKLLAEHLAMKPLLSIEDIARTIKKSVRSCETLLARGKLPPPLWIGGVRRWHVDAIDAYLRSCQK